MYMRTGIRQSMNLTLLHVPRRDLPVHQRCRLSRELAVCAMSLPRLVLLTILPRTPGSLRWGSNIVVARSRCCNSCECRGSSVAAHHHHCCGLRSGPQFLLMVSIVLVVVVVLVPVGLVSICGRRKYLSSSLCPVSSPSYPASSSYLQSLLILWSSSSWSSLKT